MRRSDSSVSEAGPGTMLLFVPRRADDRRGRSARRQRANEAPERSEIQQVRTTKNESRASAPFSARARASTPTRTPARAAPRHVERKLSKEKEDAGRAKRWWCAQGAREGRETNRWRSRWPAQASPPGWPSGRQFVVSSLARAHTIFCSSTASGRGDEREAVRASRPEQGRPHFASARPTHLVDALPALLLSSPARATSLARHRVADFCVGHAGRYRSAGEGERARGRGKGDASMSARGLSHGEFVTGAASLPVPGRPSRSLAIAFSTVWTRRASGATRRRRTWICLCAPLLVLDLARTCLMRLVRHVE